MDVVYVVRPGDTNEELRYSLRALAAHVPHRLVWLVGFHPSWVTGVEHIPIRQVGATKWANSTTNLRTACDHPGVDDRFLYFNDDMFVMAPIDEMPVLNRGPVADVAADYAQRGSYRYLDGMRATARLLGELGHPDPLSFELHVPLPVIKPLLAETLDRGRASGIEVLHKRTLYGNLAGLTGDTIEDVKVCNGRPDWSPDAVFLSTDDHEFANGAVGEHIRAAFPEPCRYEVR